MNIDGAIGRVNKSRRPSLVDYVNRFAATESGDVVGRHLHEASARLDGGPGHVRCHNEIGCTQERIIVSYGFSRGYVGGGRPRFAGAQRVCQSGFVDEAAARRVDKEGPVFHRAQQLGVDKAGVGGGLRTVQADDVGAGEDFLDALKGKGRVAGIVFGRRRIGPDLHAKGVCQLADALTDATESHEAQRFARQFGERRIPKDQ